MPLTHDGHPPFAMWDFHVFLEADWDDPLPQLLDYDETPYDLTGLDVELFVRPTWNHSTLILLCTTGNGRIDVISPATDGLLTVHVDQSVMETIEPGAWQWFMRVTDGSFYKELARGEFFAHPGRD